MERYHHGNPFNIYWWVKYSIAGKYGILGWFATEDEANSKACELLKGATRYKIIPLSTKNQAMASRKLKAVILDETKDIGQAMQRIRHKLPEKNIPIQSTTTPNIETVHFL
jgi:hypothetical protein